MEFDPHTLHHLLEKIRQQMRCPQCGEKVPVDFGSVRMSSDDFLLLQLKCQSCQAFIVLHASLQIPKAGASVPAKQAERDMGLNVSSTFCKSEEEVKDLRNAIQNSGGSFTQMFGKTEKKIV
jgi:hypothetical protein